MKYLTFANLRAKLGGRARSSIYLDVEAGRLPPPIKLGGRLYWCETDVDDWLRTAPFAIQQAPAVNGRAAARPEQDTSNLETANNSGSASRDDHRNSRSLPSPRTDQQRRHSVRTLPDRRGAK